MRRAKSCASKKPILSMPTPSESTIMTSNKHAKLHTHTHTHSWCQHLQLPHTMSRDVTFHYSFDFAQQVHFPSSPLQPGLIYCKTPNTRSAEFMQRVCQNMEYISSVCHNTEFMSRVCQNTEFMSRVCQNMEFMSRMCQNTSSC